MAQLETKTDHATVYTLSPNGIKPERNQKHGKLIGVPKLSGEHLHPTILKGVNTFVNDTLCFDSELAHMRTDPGARPESVEQFAKTRGDALREAHRVNREAILAQHSALNQSRQTLLSPPPPATDVELRMDEEIRRDTPSLPPALLEQAMTDPRTILAFARSPVRTVHAIKGRASFEVTAHAKYADELATIDTKTGALETALSATDSIGQLLA